jgi:hypothetical protein
MDSAAGDFRDRHCRSDLPTAARSDRGVTTLSVHTPRNVFLLLVAFSLIALVATWLPPLFPPTIPQAHVPMWWALAALSGGFAVLLTVRQTTPRAIVLSLGWLLVVLTVLQAFLVGDLIAMFSTWLVVPALAPDNCDRNRGRLSSPRTRSPRPAGSVSR